MKFNFIFLSLLLTLSACGFHLKGKSELPESLQQIHLSQSGDAEFDSLLLNELNAADAQIVESKESAQLIVSLTTVPEVVITQTSAVDLQVDRLNIELVYSLKGAGGKWFAQQKKIYQVRDFEFDNTQPSVEQRQKQKLYTQMKENLVRILMYQIRLVK